MAYGTSTNQKFGHSGSRKKQSFAAPVIFLSLLTLVLAVSVGLLLRQALKQKEIVEVTVLEKQDLSAQKDSLIGKLNELETAYQILVETNTGYQQELLARQEEIQRLREQIRQAVSPEVLAQCIGKIEDMKVQLGEFRERMSQLQAENRVLSGENVQIRTALDQVTSISNELQSENLEMAEQISRASILNLSDVEVVPLRDTWRGERETMRARRADKLRVCFTIQKNTLAHAGEHTFYFQFLGPTNEVLENQFQESVDLQGQQTDLSHKENIIYQNAEKTACVDFDYPAGFEKGTHQLLIFSGEHELWRGLFDLN
jgi:predicted nuclease with TOPRIM domain